MNIEVVQLMQGPILAFFFNREVDSVTRGRPILKKIDVGFKFIIQNSH